MLTNAVQMFCVALKIEMRPNGFMVNALDDCCNGVKQPRVFLKILGSVLILLCRLELYPE